MIKLLLISKSAVKMYYLVSDEVKQDCEELLKEMRIPYSVKVTDEMTPPDFPFPEDLYPNTHGGCDVLALDITKEDLFEAERQALKAGEQLNMDIEDFDFVIE